MKNKQGKVWGETCCFFNKNNVEIHSIVAKPKGAKCSKHYHNNKYNMFIVVRGALKIRVWKNDYDLVDETILGAGESMTVAPGEYHQFEVASDIPTEAFEVYWTELDQNDICRETCGEAPEQQLPLEY